MKQPVASMSWHRSGRAVGTIRRIWSKGSDPKARTGGRIASLVAVVLVVSVAYALFISWLDPALPWPATFTRWVPWKVAALNVLPALLLTLCLTVLTRRLVLACWLTVLVLAAVYTMNAYKLEQLATPLLPDDIHFLRELAVSFSLFSHYLTISQARLGIAVLIVGATLALCFEPAVSRLAGWRRGALGVTALVLCVTLAYGAAPWNRIYNAGRLQFEPWAPLESAMRTGLLTNLILFSWELANPRIGTPDRSAAASLLNELGALSTQDSMPATALLANAEWPDIVIVQSESLFDAARLAGVAQDAVYLPNYHRLSQQGWSGDLRVPTYGGGTIRTEFEVLTGLGLDAFPRVRYPYLELTRHEMPGLVRVLTQHGYRTVAIHPNSGAFWNRNRTFKSMGFDRFVDVRNFPRPDPKSWFVSDAALTDRILAELADEGPPQFILAISLQNHGPYANRDDIDPKRAAAVRLPAGVPAHGEKELRHYLVLAEDADRELGRLAEALQQRTRPTLLLFYSDHLPALGAAFFELGFADDRSPLKQTVPWLLLDNRATEGRRENVSAWQLPGLLLSAAGIGGGRYFDILEAFRHRWSIEGLVNDDAMRKGLAAVTQLEYDGALGSVLESDGAIL